ncbi:MAG TPA: AAA family ATPase [Alphaproteobacteria bacterium]|nr:AAA family ATPase [Alphaproteobacteria bacterium]
MLLPPLESFGTRIMICGPSNSGKSTLAVAIGGKLGIPAVHLDLLQHLPNTDWQPRPADEFRALHDAAILADAWAMDGNYSRLMPQRLARATGIILLGDHRWANFARYLRRTLFERSRAGMLEGGRDSLKWTMVRWILVDSPKALIRYRASLPKAGLPFVEVRGMGQLRRLYGEWRLERPVRR